MVFPRVNINSKNAAKEAEAKIKSSKIVIKIVSSKTLHKTESGGVKIIAKNLNEIEKTVAAMAKKFPEAEGLMLCEFIEHASFSLGEELMLGARADDSFGPIISFGVGGTNAEDLTKSLKTGLVPSIMPIALAHNRGVWDDFLEKSWIWRYAAGKVRGGKRLCADGEIIKWFESFAYVMKHFSDNGSSKWAISEFEVNPLCVSKGGIVALDGVLRFIKAKKKRKNKTFQKRHRRNFKSQNRGRCGLEREKNEYGEDNSAKCHIGRF